MLSVLGWGKPFDVAAFQLTSCSSFRSFLHVHKVGISVWESPARGREMAHSPSMWSALLCIQEFVLSSNVKSYMCVVCVAKAFVSLICFNSPVLLVIFLSDSRVDTSLSTQ